MDSTAECRGGYRFYKGTGTSWARDIPFVIDQLELLNLQKVGSLIDWT